MDSCSYIGHCDGIENGEICGWALSLSDPSKAVLISVLIDGVPAIEVSAGYYRPDVAEAIKCSGRNGFYVNIEALCGATGRRCIDVQFPDGSSLEGSPFEHTISKSRRPNDEPTLLFMHIPKTAGTAFRELVLSNYKQSEIAYIYGDPPGFPSTCLRDIPLRQRSQCRLVFGHYGYGVHCDMPNRCNYAALIRDPLHRIWSHYSHLVRDRHPSAMKDGIPRTIEDMLANKQSVFLDNLYVRYFCGLEECVIPPGSVSRDIYEQARSNARQPNVFLGQQSDLLAAYNLLAQQQGWASGSNCSWLNGSPLQLGPTEQEIKAIEHFNSWDFQLYQDMLLSTLPDSCANFQNG